MPDQTRSPTPTPHPTWPLYDLVVRTPQLELRLPTEDEFVALLAHSTPAIYERTGFMPFMVDWVGKPEESMRFFWRSRAGWSADSWQLPLGVFVDGRPVGIQDLFATNFGLVRAAHTGSWLIGPAQGEGIGTEMRTAVLHLAFAELGAEEAHSEAHVDNTASNAVSRKLGYDFTHKERMSFGDTVADQWRMILRRSTWESHPAHRRDDIEIIGLDHLRAWFIAPTHGS